MLSNLMVAVENDAGQVLADVVADRVPAVVAQGSEEDLKDPLKDPPIFGSVDLLDLEQASSLHVSYSGSQSLAASSSSSHSSMSSHWLRRAVYLNPDGHRLPLDDDDDVTSFESSSEICRRFWFLHSLQ